MLCAIGIYGVGALSARSRRRELAIRAALGASASALTRSAVRRELSPVVAGLGAALALAFLNAPVVSGVPFETNPRDWGAYAIPAVTLLAVATAASYRPIRHAATVPPAETLKG